MSNEYSIEAPKRPFIYRLYHHCHAAHCKTPTPPKLFMCPRHWAMVPKAMQDEVWAAFHAARTRDDRLRSRRYLTACAAAVDRVMGVEGFVYPAMNSYWRLIETQSARGVLI